MYSFVTLCCLVSSIALPSILNILAYPVSLKTSVRISNYIVKVLAPRLFAILNCYRHFHFFGYNETKENLPDQFLIISNHQSLLDIPCYMNFFRDKELRFVAKDILERHIPLVSEMLRAQEHCMIPRKGSPMEAMKIVEKFGKRVIERNQIPVLFPEGTRTRNGNVGKFYSAGFRKLNESANLPIVACALDGGYQIRDLRHIMSNLKNGCYRVKVMKVFDPPKTKDEEVYVLEESRRLIQEQLNQWRKLDTDAKY
ncbi:MAG: lysophospholipid acyltransferase family protein [Treponema sp.]|nr:lysophospholipid acyltransferase family protein [Treponema sp.]